MSNVPLAIMSIADFLASSLPEASWLVDDVIPARSVVTLVGKPKVGKSWLVLQLVIGLAAGRQFLGRATVPHRTVYVTEEGNASMLQERIAHLAGGLSSDGANGFLAIHRGYRLESDESAGRLIADLRPFEPELVVLDPLVNLLGSVDENENGQMALVMGRVRKLANELAATVIVVHHPSRGRADSDAGDAGRGASVVQGATDGNIVLKGDDGAFVLAGSMRDCLDFRLRLDRDPATMLYSLAEVAQPAPRMTPDRLLMIVGPLGEFTVAKAAETAGLSDTTVRKNLDQLKADGRIRVARRVGREEYLAAA